MSGLSIALNNALSGLNVNQQALGVLSQNIANANTPGYSRQIINQQAVYLDGQGEGVSIKDITRQVDDYLNKAVQQQGSTVGQTGVIDDYNTRIQLLMGQPGSQNSIDSYVNSFFNSVQSLAQTPQDTTLQQGVVNSGITLASQVQQLAQGVQNLQLQADVDINTAVTAVNNDLKTLSQLNISIGNSTALGKSVADLQDQRDSVLNDISQYMNIQTYTNPNGAISVTAGNGVPLLDDGIYQLSFTPAAAPETFSNGSSLSALTVQRIDDSGNPIGLSTQLVSGGTPSEVVSSITGGKIAGLLDMRDTQLPNIMSQLDTLAATVRDQVNAIQNAGSGFPGANSYTGTRAVNASDYSQWSGSARIAVLTSAGQPIPSPYADEPNGMPPLNLDLSSLNTGQGTGSPSVQGILDAINQYYGVPQNKAELGNLNNIQLVSDSTSLPGSPAGFKFDFDLNNISASPSNFYVLSTQVKDSSGASMTPVNSTVPSVASSSYVTSAGSNIVTVNTAGLNNGLTEGQTVFLSDPGGSVDSIPEADMTGFFTISNVTPTSFQITVNSSQAAGASPTSAVGQTATPPYSTVAAGEDARTGADGIITASLTNNAASPYYDVTATVAVDDGTGNIKQSQITYRVTNNQPSMLNTQIAASAVTGDGTLVTPAPGTPRQPIATATLVDANGNELPKVNGKYVTTQSGFLKIQATNSSNVIAIDSLDSIQQGQPNNTPPVSGTNRGFSYYFDLNDFFQSNQPTNTGDTVAGSALDMAVSQRLQNNPGLVATGTLAQSSPPVGSGPPNYTYQLTPGDNSVIQNLSNLGIGTLLFPPTGGLGASTQTLSAYAGQIIGASASNAATAKTNSTNAQSLMDGYTQQASSISGVNLDTELANTVIYQNAYAASARVITVTNDLFNTLLQSFQ